MYFSIKIFRGLKAILGEWLNFNHSLEGGGFFANIKNKVVEDICVGSKLCFVCCVSQIWETNQFFFIFVWKHFTLSKLRIWWIKIMPSY